MRKTSSGTEIERLIALLARLPGLGHRSARKAALALIKRREDLLQPLAAALNAAAQKIIECANCGNIDTVSPCSICQDPRRDRNLIVVVEEIADLWALERAGVRQIEISGVCTACHTDEFFSHRAEHGRTGRFGAVMALAEQ